MASIIQQPDALSLTGNMKKLIIQTTDNVTVKLLCGDDIITNEIYAPTNEQVELDFSKVVKNHLSFSIPADYVTVQSSMVKTFTIDINNSALTASFLAIRAGVKNLSLTAAEFLKSHFLTWQPISVKTTKTQPQWLTYYNSTSASVNVKLKFYLKNGESKLFLLGSIDAGVCKTFSLQFAYIYGLIEDEKYGYYDVYVEDASAVRLTYIQRYIYTADQNEQHQYAWENSLGGIDSVNCTGSRTEESDGENTIAEKDEVNELEINKTEIKYTQNSGLKTQKETAWLKDLVLSEKQYAFEDGNLTPISLTNSSVSNVSADDMQSLSFTYKINDDQGYLNISRTETLPDNLEIPTPDSLFFLTPDLTAFPVADLSGELLFAVQTPYKKVWKQLSFNVLKDYFKSLLNGITTRNIRDRGKWSKDMAESSTPYLYNATVQDQVYHNNCFYRCITSKTLEEPSFNANDWVMVMGSTELALEIDSSNGDTFLSGKLSTILTAKVFRGLNDISSEVISWKWSRTTTDTAADTVWNTEHSSDTTSVNLTNEDLQDLSGVFTCTAIVNNDGDTTKLTAQIIF